MRLFKPKLVQFDDGKFGLRSHWFFGWHFHSLTTDYTWCGDCKVTRFCKGSLSEVQGKIQKLNLRKYSKKHKVRNVI